MSGNEERIKIKPVNRIKMKCCLMCKHKYIAYPYTGKEYRCNKHEELGSGPDYIVVRNFEGCDYFEGLFY
jgi:hypothetical protein